MLSICVRILSTSSILRSGRVSTEMLMVPSSVWGISSIFSCPASTKDSTSRKIVVSMTIFFFLSSFSMMLRYAFCMLRTAL